MKIDCIELYYVKIPLEDKKPGVFTQPKYFSPSWIPGVRQSEMRFYLLKPGTDAGQEEYAAIAAMGLERQVLDRELKPAMYLKEKTSGQMVRTAKARFALPEPSFRTG